MPPEVVPLPVSLAPASEAAGGVALADEVRARIERGLHAARGTMADETMRALRKGIVAFAGWCALLGRCPVPAAPEAVAEYVDALHEQGRKPAGIRQAVWAIGRVHTLAELPDPSGHRLVGFALKRAVRAAGSRQRQAAPIGELAAAAIQATTGRRLPDLRDLALVLVMRDMLARRSEAVALCVEDVEFAPDGTATVLVRRSKTDQAGEGAVLPLGPAAARALRAWLGAAAIASGPIFRAVNKGGRVGDDALSAGKVPTILKRLAARAGLDAARISGHSCRVGMAQDLMTAGDNTAAIQQAGRWKSPIMPARYVERIEASRSAVARYYLRRGGG